MFQDSDKDQRALCLEGGKIVGDLQGGGFLNSESGQKPQPQALQTPGGKVQSSQKTRWLFSKDFTSGMVGDPVVAPGQDSEPSVDSRTVAQLSPWPVGAEPAPAVRWVKCSLQPKGNPEEACGQDLGKAPLPWTAEGFSESE